MWLKRNGRCNQGRREACTPYTEYRGPGLRGAREGPLYNIKFFLKNYKKKVERKKRKKVKKSIIPKKQKMFLYLGALGRSPVRTSPH